MSLNLEYNVQNPVISTNDFLKIDLVLSNNDSKTHVIPGPQDQSACLTIDVYDKQNTLFRRINGISLQHMLTTGRVSLAPDLDELAPGQKWQWTMELCSYHYPLPVGDYTIKVNYDYKPENIALACPHKDIKVVESSIQSIQVYRFNPVLDGLLLLCKHTNAQQQTTYNLRLLGQNRPLVAWYSEMLPVLDDAEQAIVATPDFFNTDTFDHYFQTWVVWKNKQTLSFQKYDNGKAISQPISFQAKDANFKLHSAFYNERDELTVFILDSDLKLRCVKVADSKISLAFSHTLSTPDTNTLKIQSHDNSYHLCYFNRGVVYEKLNLDGTIEKQELLYKSRLSCHSLEMDGVERIIKVILRDTRKGRTFEFVKLGYDSGETTRFFLDKIKLRQQIHEIVFDCDDHNRFHILLSTMDKKLYYYNDDRSPALIDQGQTNYFPNLVTDSRIFLGYSAQTDGYIYKEYRRARHGSKFVNYDVIPD